MFGGFAVPRPQGRRGTPTHTTSPSANRTPSPASAHRSAGPPATACRAAPAPPPPCTSCPAAGGCRSPSAASSRPCAERAVLWGGPPNTGLSLLLRKPDARRQDVLRPEIRDPAHSWGVGPSLLGRTANQGQGSHSPWGFQPVSPRRPPWTSFYLFSSRSGGEQWAAMELWRSKMPKTGQNG